MEEEKKKFVASCPKHILQFLQKKIGIVNDFHTIQVSSIRSAQQQVYVLQFVSSKDMDGIVGRDVENFEIWREAMRFGRNHLVVRIWKGANRWWNLNHCIPNPDSDSLQTIAKYEVFGYQWSRQILQSKELKSRIRIPAVLYFSLSDDPIESPWAIFEYVGRHSMLWNDSRVMDESWLKGMVKIRDEFGFPEPHPRWGRVPVEYALQYAVTILDSVILPLHCHSLFLPSMNNESPIKAPGYVDMVCLCQDKWTSFLKEACKCSARDDTQQQEQQASVIMKLGEALEELTHNYCAGVNAVKDLQPVLCHMDLQPQNILFAKDFKNDAETVSYVISVLDWEEASYADPRFDLLMLCRRVCANRSQADIVWNRYQEYRNIELGPIVPWLKMETVHNITTLLLHALGRGGRNPWETKRDLDDKIQRDLKRLQAWNT